MLAAWTLAPTTAMAAPVDAGAELDRGREAMERARIAEQMREDKEAREAKVEHQKEGKDERAAEVTFDLRKVNFDDSVIFSPEELDGFASEYVGRTVSIQDLYDLVEKINALYEKKGYLTCRAFLPPQRIHDGEVAIRLIEGKTGELSVKGNKHTKAGYIKEHFDATPGEVANTDTLTRQLQHFNGTHDVQLRMVMHAGRESGTTDYEILAYEPKRNQSVTLFADNNGYETSGRWREGIYYLDRSLSGCRDNIRVHYQHSQGSNAWGLGYAVPLNRHGMKLDFEYSGNQTELIDGPLRAFGLKGNAWALAMTLRVPFLVDGKHRYETGFQYVRQHSKTDFGNNDWVDDHTSRYVPYISFTHYGNDDIFYHRHSLARGHKKNIMGDSSDTWNYMLSTFYQKIYRTGELLQVRFDGQFASADVQELASADRFYIGGVSSVRGYEESLLMGKSGYTASIECQFPIVKERNVRALAFLDYGRVFGAVAAAPDMNMLISTGLGVVANLKDVTASLVLGVPLKRGIGEQKVDRARLHFTLSATF